MKERVLEEAVVVQILGVEDMGKSRWEQLEAIEAQERGEMTKGREVIRTIAADDNGENASGRGTLAGGSGGAGSGPHKLVLQDWKGQRVFGIELRRVAGVRLGMDIGTKVVLKGAVVARGCILLEPKTVVLLGGKIDVLHRAWLDGRKGELREGIEAAER